MSAALLALAPLVLLGGAAAAETLARRRDRRRHPPPGTLWDVGGHRMHARVLGEGDPVVVLEADVGSWSTHWGTLPEELGRLATVVAYDRAGLGWSDSGPAPRDVSAHARELHQLLLRIAPERPVLLVAHGFGAYVARAYRHRYPYEVAGLVLVDGYHEQLESVLRARRVPTPSTSPLLLRALFTAGRFGALRALGVDPLAQDGIDPPLSAEPAAAARALALTSRVQETALAELRAGPASEAHVAQLTEPCDLPVRVVTAAETLSAEGSPDGFPREEFNRVWAAQNAELLGVSTRAVQILARESDHLVPLRAPELVVRAVREVLEEARLAPAD